MHGNTREESTEQTKKNKELLYSLLKQTSNKSNVNGNGNPRHLPAAFFYSLPPVQQPKHLLTHEKVPEK